MTGSTDLLDQNRVVFGGDQLTRVRMQGAKKLRVMGTTPARRFEHLQPVVFEQWHNKQDFLHVSLCL